MDFKFWKGRKVLVTGHTGFKGAWACILLKELGAQVAGYSIDVPTEPSLFKVMDIGRRIDRHIFGDILDEISIRAAIRDFSPEIVLHLAAQSLVLRSYENPIKTYQTNVIGTMIVLNELRNCASARACVVVTTDKCYQNNETGRHYQESDPLGGFDPYSSSKACAEILTASMRQSFFNEDEMRISTVRAGNVIGGGDWASNRLVTDLLRAVQADEPMELRNPTSRRPWQHVLEPISAYLEIARMNHQCTLGSDSFNIGPDSGSEITTEDFARKFMEAWGAHHLTSRIVKMEKHEAKLLMLDNAKIKKSVGWAPRWSIEKAIDSTVGWYREYYRNGDVQKSTLGQIEEYFRGSPV